MVALKRYCIAICVAGVAAFSVGAQQIRPRVEGLEADSVYMNLLSEELSLTTREDSIALHVGELRALLRDNPDNIDAYSDNIISSESALFELRARKATVIDSINLIEQDWVLKNIKPAERVEVSEQFIVEDTLADMKYIYQSANMRKHLGESDYKNLVKAEELELKAQQYNDDYVLNIERMKSLRSSYEVARMASEADSIMCVFDSLDMANRHLMQNLDDTWGFVYDNKSFAYSMVMEILGVNRVLKRESNLMRDAQAEISRLQGDNVRDEILRYRVQRSSMVEYESLVASALNLEKLSDSLSTLHTYLSKIDKVEAKRVDVEERLFIVYEPAIFSTTTIYNSENPIPQTAVYDKGLIFRIYLGSFSEKQRASIFRKTSPISYEVTDDNRYAYYAGGYATLAEAEEAQKKLKQHGFRKPQIVVWSDGKSRNLTEEPYEIQNNYRIIIEDRTNLPDGLLDCVLDAGSSISKVGNDKYVIAPLVRASQADSLEQQLMVLDPQFRLKREMDEGKYEF